MLVLIPLAKKMSSYRNVSMLANVSALANVSIKPPYDYELVSISSISYSSPVIGGELNVLGIQRPQLNYVT